MNLLQQQASNRRRTWFVVAAFLMFLLALGYGFDRFYLGAQGVSLPIGSGMALGLGSISALVGYFGGDRAVLLSAGAVPLQHSLSAATSDDQRFKLKQLDNVVDEMSIAAGLPKPKIYVVPDSDPNAFATGRDPRHASIAVTRGLLDLLGRDELQAVLAHEMSHIRNLDVRLMTLVAALVGAVALLADWTLRGSRRGALGKHGTHRKRDGNGGVFALVLFAIWLVAAMLAPLVGQLLAMTVSRRREYLADASGAELTRNPGALADALAKIDAAVEPTRAVKQGSAHLCIADPLGRAMGIREGFWADLLATHPPMTNRIAALRAMAYQPTSL